MAPTRIMFIRHAEKPHEPPCENDDGVKTSGERDEKSLAVQGWQRAGRSFDADHGRFSSVTRNGSSLSIVSGDCV